ncbi:MAG: hypothetical protein HC806_06685 [Anaerolineae bacterium]|nr:hypothetical protein [Anaerolineae bacterium]
MTGRRDYSDADAYGTAKNILIPYQKQQAERPKTALGLIRADRGGLVYQPIVGVHRHVAEIDFISMYPSVMVHFNISPETPAGQGGRCLGKAGDRDEYTSPGLVPETLRPLLAKRIEIKSELATLSHQDCRYPLLKARANALKWLLVVCFGYLGYKNARFGRIESHEAVTAYGREVLLQAKEAAEDMGVPGVAHVCGWGYGVQRGRELYRRRFPAVVGRDCDADEATHCVGGGVPVGEIFAVAGG